MPHGSRQMPIRCIVNVTKISEFVAFLPTSVEFSGLAAFDIVLWVAAL